MKRLLALAVILGVFAAAASASTPPVTVIETAAFGHVLAAPSHLALYYWTPEKHDHRIHCTGACAKAWPPLLVRTASAVPRHIHGARGTFGVIRRPDGPLQVT